MIDTSAVQLPPAGPGWAGSVMGTAILAAVLQVHGLHAPAAAVLVVAWVLAAVLAAGFVRHRSPRLAPVSGAAQLPAWGMVAMGLMALGSASSGVAGLWGVHAATAVAGGALSVLTCLGFLRHLLAGRPGGPALTWGLPLVAPMVTATAAAQLADRLREAPPGEWAPAWLPPAVDAAGAACFLLALATSVPVFVRVGADLLRGAAFPADSRSTAWIPMGIVGQSVAAAQLLVRGTGLEDAAHVYGWAALAAGVPVAAWAAAVHWDAALRRRMAYNPTWWAATFPVGTMCLGTHLLAAGTGQAWLDAASAGLLATLVVHWLWAAQGVRHLLRR